MTDTADAADAFLPNLEDPDEPNGHSGVQPDPTTSAVLGTTDSGPAAGLEEPPALKLRTVDEYLADHPEVPPPTAAKGNAKAPPQRATAGAARAPLVLTPTTTTHPAAAVSRLNEMAQVKGYGLNFDVTTISHNPPSFGGKLEILGSEETLVLGKSYGSKKDAKAALGAIGLPVMQSLPSRYAQGHGPDATPKLAANGDSAGDETDNINWVGRLLGGYRHLPRS